MQLSWKNQISLKNICSSLSLVISYHINFLPSSSSANLFLDLQKQNLIKIKILRSGFLLKLPFIFRDNRKNVLFRSIPKITHSFMADTLKKQRFVRPVERQIFRRFMFKMCIPRQNTVYIIAQKLKRLFSTAINTKPSNLACSPCSRPGMCVSRIHQKRIQFRNVSRTI